MIPATPNAARDGASVVDLQWFGDRVIPATCPHCGWVGNADHLQWFGDRVIPAT